jgi:hypothetical protein
MGEEGNMGFIPDDARWYLADLVLEYRVAGDPRNLVQINTHLIEAESPQQAHEKAKALGRSCKMRYRNSDGKQVRILFRGLRELNVIHEELEDGAELSYGEAVGVPEEQLHQWIRPKRKLAVFVPIQPRMDGPNTMPEQALQMLEAQGCDGRDLRNCLARRGT